VAVLGYFEDRDEVMSGVGLDLILKVITDGVMPYGAVHVNGGSELGCVLGDCRGGWGEHC